jgi:biotin operon repressor
MMQYRAALCQLDGAHDRHVDTTTTPLDDTSTPETTSNTAPRTPGIEHSFEYSREDVLLPAQQWVSTTTARITTDSYSWMQAVHWIDGAGMYKPSRSYGPQWGPTTVRLAQALAELNPCIPSVDYLARRLGCSRRTVQYHLDMLREAGLLAYREKGTRISLGDRRVEHRASHYARTVPTAFDTALGIRTIGQGPERRPVGIAEENRSLIAKLAKKAARKVRRPRRKKPAPAPRCTPMQGGTPLPPAELVPTSVPPETSQGQQQRTTPKTGSSRKQQVLNPVGRRYELAKELIRRVPWLGRAANARIAWQVREVSDAGWTADEVEAWLQQREAPQTVSRPSGLLGRRLQGATLIWADPAARARALETTRESTSAARQRHADIDTGWTPPRDTRTIASLLAGMEQGQATLANRCREQGLDDLTGLAAPEPGFDAALAAFLSPQGMNR